MVGIHKTGIIFRNRCCELCKLCVQYLEVILSNGRLPVGRIADTRQGGLESVPVDAIREPATSSPCPSHPFSSMFMLSANRITEESVELCS